MAMLCLLLTVWFVKVGLNCKGPKAEEFPVACSLRPSMALAPAGSYLPLILFNAYINPMLISSD